jgi:general L-amino acid transport system substrate-binding protein
MLAMALIARDVACAAEPSATRETTLARVRAAGVLRCGIDQEQAEYTTSDDHGNREAFDADLCRAVAVAVLGKDALVRVTHYPDDRAAMQGLNAGEVEMVASLSDDFTHSVRTHLTFTQPVLWDGVGFLVLAQSPAMRARQLSGKNICFLAETTVEESVRAWFALSISGGGRDAGGLRHGQLRRAGRRSHAPGRDTRGIDSARKADAIAAGVHLGGSAGGLGARG